VLVPDDIAEWALARWNASAVTASVTGGLWNGRVNEIATSPYAMMLVTREGVEMTSGGELPRMRMNIAVMVDQATSTQAQGAAIAVGQAFPVGYSGSTAMLRNGAGTVIFAEPRECSADVAFPMRAKSDVVACRMSWEIFCQAATTGV